MLFVLIFIIWLLSRLSRPAVVNHTEYKSPNGAILPFVVAQFPTVHYHPANSFLPDNPSFASPQMATPMHSEPAAKDTRTNDATSDNEISYGKHEITGSVDQRLCSICLQDYEEMEQLRQLPCSHCFHVAVPCANGSASIRI